MDPLVSVLVTVYNRERFLEATLESILASTFTDFEVVVVDDASGDGSAAVAERLAARDSRIRFSRNGANLGDYGNRAKAASLARGRYLKYVDADDLIYRHSLALMVEAMESNPDAALALSVNVIDPAEPYPFRYSPAEAYRAHYLGRSPLGVGPSAAIIHRSCFEEIGGFSGRQFVGDAELWLKLAERWPIVALPPALVWWRRHEGQQMQLELTRPEVLNVRYRLELEMLQATQHLSAAEKLRAQEHLAHLHARRLWSLALRRGKPGPALSLARGAGLTIAEIMKGLVRPSCP